MIKFMIVTLALILVLSAALHAQQPNSCTSPGAGNLIPVIGHLSTKWNCWLQDFVYQSYMARGFSEYLSANYASQAVNQDTVDRFDEALTQIRSTNPQYFDQVMTAHGLSFTPVK